MRIVLILNLFHSKALGMRSLGLPFALIGYCVCFSPYALAKTYQVEMRNQVGNQSMVFEPSFLQVEKGDTVVFVPTDPGHNVQSVLIPKGAKPWIGETDQEVTVTLENEGVYIYECSNHAIMGMVGVIEVGKPINKEQAIKFAKEYAEKQVSNKDRLGKFLKD